MARNMREMWIQKAIFPKCFGCNSNKLKKKKYNGVENCIACEWEYDCKTWLGMHTPRKLPVKSRRIPR